MIKILATVAVVGAMLAGGAVSLPVLPEKVYLENASIKTLSDDSNNFALISSGAVKIIDGATGNEITTWAAEGLYYRANTDYSIFYEYLPDNYMAYYAYPSGAKILHKKEQQMFVLDGNGSYALLPSTKTGIIDETPKPLSVHPYGSDPYAITPDTTCSILFAGKYKNYLYYWFSNKNDKDNLVLVICDFATGAEVFRTNPEPYKRSPAFRDDRVIFGPSVYDIAAKSKIFSISAGSLYFFGQDYFSYAAVDKTYTYSMLNLKGEVIKSRSFQAKTSYQSLSRLYGGFIVEYDKDKNILLNDAFDEKAEPIKIIYKENTYFQLIPLNTKLLTIQGSELVCYDYHTKKAEWKRHYQRGSGYSLWGFPIITAPKVDDKEVLQALDYNTGEFIALPDGYNRAIKGDTLLWIFPATTKPGQPWPLVLKDGKTSNVAGSSSEGIITSAYAWKDTLMVFLKVIKEGASPYFPYSYELVRIKDGEKKVLYKTESSYIVPYFYKNSCAISEKNKIIHIDIDTTEQKESEIANAPETLFTYFIPFSEGYLCKLEGSVGMVKNSKIVKTLKGFYVDHNDEYIWTYNMPYVTEVDDDGFLYTYSELLKYDLNGQLVNTCVLKNCGYTPRRFDRNLFILGSTIIDENGTKIQSIQNFDSSVSSWIRYIPNPFVTISMDYSLTTSNVIKWAPCATYTATLSDGKLTIRNNSSLSGKTISGQVYFSFIGATDGVEITKLDGNPINIDNLAPGKEIAIDVGAVPEGKKLVFIAELNGVLDIGADPSNDFKKNHDRYIGVPMTKKIGFARVVRILE